MRLIDLTRKEVQEALKSSNLTICVVGLGRIGLPTASVFADAGANVIGVDINAEIVQNVNSGRCQFSDEPGLKELVRKVVEARRLKASNNLSLSVAKSNMIIICVPTTIDGSRTPHCPAIIDSSKKIAKSLNKGSLIVVESTVAPGMVENIITPLIEKQSQMKVTEDFGVASCPERASPGNILNHIKSIPRIVGGINPRSLEVTASIYECALGVEVIKVTNPKTANAVKLTENIVRDVNIALMNEFAVLYEKLGIDIIEIIHSCATKWNFLPHYPGAGVGGPCLSANAYYLIDEGLKVGYIPHLIRMAREINDRMPDHVISLVTDALNDVGKVVSRSKIAILGVSYKPNIHDLQKTPLRRIYLILNEMGASIAIYDPMFIGEKVFGVAVSRTLKEAVDKADCIIVGIAHKEFENLDLIRISEACNKPAALIDTGKIVEPTHAAELGFSYRGVGRVQVGLNKY